MSTKLPNYIFLNYQACSVSRFGDFQNIAKSRKVKKNYNRSDRMKKKSNYWDRTKQNQRNLHGDKRNINYHIL